MYLAYCSSDAWIGDVSAAQAQSAGLGVPFAFRGRRILAATLSALLADFGLAAKGNRLLLSGCSAGARGAMYNAESVAAAAAPHGVSVQARRRDRPPTSA